MDLGRRLHSQDTLCAWFPSSKTDLRFDRLKWRGLNEIQDGFVEMSSPTSDAIWHNLTLVYG